MRDDPFRREVARRVSLGPVELPTSALGRPARLLGGLARAGGHQVGRALRATVGRRRTPDVEPEAAVVTSLGRLKGVAMQLGQLLGSVDGLPSSLRAALAVLHTHAQPLAVDRLREVVADELGDAGVKLARALEPAPLAVAALGQVHRATLDGRALAVKIAYPDIDRVIARDFAPAALGARVAGWVRPRARLPGQLHKLRAGVLAECDLALEAWHESRLAEIFAGHDSIVVPAVQREFSSQHVVTRDFVDGRHLDEWLAGEPDAAARQRAGEALFDFYLGTLFAHGLYHSDPHPGNFLLLDDGRVAVVDFGAVRQLRAGDDEQQRALAQLRGWLPALARDEVTALEPSGVALRRAVNAEALFLLRLTLGLTAALRALDVRANWYRRLRAPSASPPVAVEPAAAARPAVDNSVWDVVLVAHGDSQIALIRELRELLGIELRDIKILLDATPQTIRRALPAVAARELRDRLERAGARIELRPAAS